METTLKFDRVILVKELNEKFCKIGEVFEVANILNNSFLLRDVNTRVEIGVYMHTNLICNFLYTYLRFQQRFNLKPCCHSKVLERSSLFSHFLFLPPILLPQRLGKKNGGVPR